MESVSANRATAIPTRTIRVGVIGTGFGASVHIPALQKIPFVEVTGICSRRPERALTSAARYSIRKKSTDYREFVRDPDIDAVVIASPPSLHHAMTVAAIEAGKHVLCEKPLARTLAESRDLVRLAQQAGVVAMVNHEFRFEPARVYTKQLIELGYLGEPHSATVTVYRSTLNDPHGVAWDWLMDEAKGGGMLRAAGSHYLDALRWWFGDIRAVSGATSTMIRQRRFADSHEMGSVSADDNFAVLLKFTSGAMATVTYSATAAFEAGEQIILSGSDGLLMMTGDRKLYGAKRGGMLEEKELPAELTEEVSPSEHPLAGPTELLLRVWIGSIRTGETESPSFLDGMKVQELMDGAVRSSQLGRWIEVERGRFQNY